MRLGLDKKDLSSYLQSLMGEYEVFAPVELSEGVTVFRRLQDPSEAALGGANSRKPAKEVFFPQSETMFRYEKAGGRSGVDSAEQVEGRRVLLGARPCDLGALWFLDRVFCGKEYQDPYYENKRQATVVIGMGCSQPRSTCFCTSLGGGPFEREQADLFWTDLGQSYLVEVLTEKGKALGTHPLLREARAEELEAANAMEQKAFQKVEGSVPVESIEQRLDQMVESPFWDRVQERCIGCRVCTYLCPTCHCFDIADEALSRQGQRVRHWDSCQSALYSQETSGHNPRPTNRERTRQRLMHKFNYFPKTAGRIACVGCGRCILFCPAHSDLRATIREIASSEG